MNIWPHLRAHVQAALGSAKFLNTADPEDIVLDHRWVLENMDRVMGHDGVGRVFGKEVLTAASAASAPGEERELQNLAEADYAAALLHKRRCRACHNLCAYASRHCQDCAMPIERINPVKRAQAVGKALARLHVELARLLREHPDEPKVQEAAVIADQAPSGSLASKGIPWRRHIL